jgi:hypothetical protein
MQTRTNDFLMVRVQSHNLLKLVENMAEQFESAKSIQHCRQPVLRYDH